MLTQTLLEIRITGDPAAPVLRTSTSFATAVRRVGITDFTFHDVRRIFVSRLVMRGVDLATVKELMGHKHIYMTRRYAHLAPGRKRSAIAVLDQIEGKVPSIFTTSTNRILGDHS